MLIFTVLCLAQSYSDSIPSDKRLQKTYAGTWKGGSFLTEDSGLVSYKLESSKNIFTLFLNFHDGIWTDDPVQSFSTPNLFYNYSSEILSFNFTSKSQIFQGAIQYNLQSSNASKYSNGTIYSENLKVHIRFKGEINNQNVYEKPRVVYSFMLFCMLFFQTFTFTKYQELVILSDSIAKKSSILFWFTNAGIDFSLAMFNVQEIIRDLVSFESMMMGFIWSLISFFTIRSKMLFLLYKAQNDGISMQAVYLKFSRAMVLFCKGYIDLIMILANVLAYQMKPLYYLLISLMVCMYMPQIYLNARDNMTTPLSPYIAISISYSRIIILVLFT